MGTFIGHAVPGTFFIIFALWWTIQISKRYFVTKQWNIPYYNTATFPCCYGRALKMPIEGAVKLVLSLIGVVSEFWAATDYGQENHFVYMGDLQHVTMFAFFALSGLVDVLVHYKKILPEKTDYAVAAMAFSVEWILFSHHLHGRRMLDVHVHTLLLYVVAACVLATILEAKYSKSIYVAQARAFFVLLQGTWFWQVGFMLYSPSWHPIGWETNNPEHVMLATMVFTWHAAGVICAMFIIAIFVKKVYPKCCPPTSAEYGYRRLSSASVGKTEETYILAGLSDLD